MVEFVSLHRKPLAAIAGLFGLLWLSNTMAARLSGPVMIMLCAYVVAGLAGAFLAGRHFGGSADQSVQITELQRQLDEERKTNEALVGQIAPSDFLD